MGIDSRLSPDFVSGMVGSHVLRFRVRFAFERWKTKLSSVVGNLQVKGTNGKVSCDRGIAGEGEDDQ